MKVIDESVSSIQKVEYEMLKALLKCCDELHIKAFLVGGSALGAVRHHGFIPWDDDIDVAMMRPDFERFIINGQKYLPEHLFLQSRISEPELLINFAKIRNSKTTFIETSVKNSKINHGIYIDIFPLDYFPDNVWEQKRLRKKLRLLNMRVRQEYSLPDMYRGSKPKEALKKFVGVFLKIRYPSVSKVLELRDKIYKSVKESSYIVNYSGAWGNKEVFPIEWLGEGVFSNFEGLTISIPKEYDKYLSQLYGDYMQLPPIDEQKSHHYTEIIDTDNN